MEGGIERLLKEKGKGPKAGKGIVPMPVEFGEAGIEE
jgi:hypothetical protein